MASAHQHRDVVPGTIHLVDLEHHTGHDADVVLNPRPSSDPEDPLNWKPWRKQVAIWSMYTYIFGIAISSAVQYSVLTNISASTGITVAELNTGTGLMFLFLGWGCLIWQPIALVFGRRGVYLMSSLLCLAPMIWMAYSNSVGEWYAHRILFGIFGSSVESLGEITVQDLFFAHERGFYMGVYTVFVFAPNALAPVCAGFITNNMGWRAACWFGTIVLAVTTVICFFTLEETMYFRSTVEGIDDGDADVAGQVVDTTSAKLETHGEKSTMGMDTTPTTSSPAPEPVFVPPRTYIQKLALFRNMPGRPSVKQMFIMMYRPLLYFFYFPSVDWAGFLYGINLSWYNVVNGTMSLILSSPPYNFSASMVGVAFLSPMIGACLGGIYTGWVGDKLALYFARRNGGVREPEHRLWVLIISGLIGGTGFLMWGVGAANDVHFMVLIVGVGMVMAMVVAGGSAALSYDVDCFKDISGETMILVIVIRNTLGFGFSYGITPWLDNQGYTRTFVAVAVLSIVCNFSFLFLTVWGKKLRKFSAKKYWEFVDTLVVGASH